MRRGANQPKANELEFDFVEISGIRTISMIWMMTVVVVVECGQERVKWLGSKKKRESKWGTKRGFATRKTRINRPDPKDDDERSERMTEGVAG